MIEHMSAEEYRERFVQKRKSANRIAGGRKAQRKGREFQEELNDYHAALVAAGVLPLVVETAPEMRAAMVGDRPYYVMLGKGPVDYLFLMPSGIAGTFDAKSVDEVNRFTWPEKSNHQLVALRRCHEVSMGAAPMFALVQWRSRGEVRLHPIQTIGTGNIVHRNDGVICPAQPWPSVPDGPYREGASWLPVVRSLWNL